ncbi:uroporphyrinogen-III synthase [Hoeflea sp. AS60]|uniref:uroporphyrinogen-III synthase n=1 Tax=Hoeflea sp. AS60 TaxID=3135780 RepID=UPI0031779EC1
MRVLVTRPEPGGQRTAERLAALGHDPVLMPLFETMVTATIDDLPPADEVSGLIATSARAFALFKSGDVTQSGLRNVPIHAVGPATAQAARDAGFVDVREGGGTASALSQTLMAARMKPREGRNPVGSDVRPGALVYLAGVPRTPVIETALEAEKIDFSVMECYKMSEISYSTDILKSDIFSLAPDAVLFFSANAAQHFSNLLSAEDIGKALDSARFICLSDQIAARLPSDWQVRSIVSGRPDEDSLLASLVALG